MRCYFSILLCVFSFAVNSQLYAQSFKDDMLKQHNYWRAQVGVTPLQWSDNLAKSAEKWVKTLARKGCDLQHSNSEYGENLWMGMGEYSAIEIVDSWASEQKHYNATTNTCANGEVCGHYTQMVWESSTELGCATITCNNGWTIVICQFNPPGNYVGERPFSPNNVVGTETNEEVNATFPTRFQEIVSRDLIENKNPEVENGEARSYLLNLAKNYCSDAYSILTYDPNENISQWVDDFTEKGIVDDFSTVVHETLHGYDHKLGGFNSNGYFISKGIELVVPHQKFINSNKLNNFVPASIRSQLSRYELYIGDGSDMSSQLNGIYGILEEYNGYYHGLKAVVELKKANAPHAQNDWISDELESFWEFDLFVAWYLQLCQQQYPDVYQSLMNDTKLRVAYTLIHRNFAQLAQEIKQHSVISKNYSTSKEKLYTAADDRMLASFQIPEVTKDNYQRFFK